MPLQSEWKELVRKLIYSATESGILRAHFELMRLRELYEFAESDTWTVIDEGYDFEVIFPEEAREFLDKYSLEISVITDETVLNRIREALRKGLEEGISNKELIERIRRTSETWLSEWHAQTIARTETGKMYNAGRLARWLDPEINGFVEALQYDAIIDKRTTELCKHLDGKIVSIKRADVIAEYTPPNHFQCRSTWLPITKYEEWEDNFTTDIKPEEGFVFKAPLPKLLQGKQEPLVQPRKKVDPRQVTDPDIIRNLNDDDFKIAIKNIKDIALKLNLIKERAEQMLVRETNLKEVAIKAGFTYWGYVEDEMEGSFDMFGEYYTFYMHTGMRETVEEFFRKLLAVKDDANALRELIEEFAKEHGADPEYADVIAKLRKAISGVKVKMKWDGLKEVEQTKESKKLLTMKMPPRTANFKNATGLQQALRKAQEWLLKYIDPSLAPKTGIKVRFQYDLYRAYATGASGEVYFGAIEKEAGVVIHEVGHVFHWNNKAVADLINEFYQQRTKDDKITLYQGEKTKKDNFYNPYVGRVYGWEWEFENSKYATREFMGQEVLSMGIQALYERPEEFYAMDKEHFLLIYAIIRGLF